MHCLSCKETLVVQEWNNSSFVSAALQKIIVKLSKQIPILYDSWVNAFLKYPLVEGFTIICRSVIHIFTYVWVNDVIKLSIVSIWMIIVIGWERIQQIFHLIINTFLISLKVRNRILPFYDRCPIRINQLSIGFLIIY